MITASRSSSEALGPRGSRRRAGWAGPALVLWLLSAPALGANLGPHQDAVATNPCRVCHNTAAGVPALRGWVGAGVGPVTGWGSKAISALCYDCHNAGGGRLTTPGHNMLANAYADVSHGFTIADAPEEPEGSPQDSGLHPAISASGLPYVALATLECTSCHSVHVADSRPFSQRPTIQGLCDECHGGRRADGVDTRNVPGQLRLYSTHPTRRALIDTARANVKGVAGIAAALKVGTPAAPGWALGGHLDTPAGNDGPLDCQTCHAVHGPAQGTGGTVDLLAIDNTTGAGGSALCEGCHFGGAAGEQVGAAVLQAGLPAGQWSDHPIDNLGNRAFYPTGVAIPAGWTAALTQDRDRGAQPLHAGGAPTCSSCHDTHGGIAGTQLLRGPQPVGLYGAMSYDDWCFACHAAAQVIPGGHHSVIGNLAASQLSCGDCHGPAGTLNWSAHNGFWTFAIALSDTDSALCLGCHSAADPADLIAEGVKGLNNFTEPAAFPATHGTVRGTGSHYLGLDSDEFPGVAPKLTAWPTTGYFSSYGPPNTGGGGLAAPAGAGAIICESCHDILHNDGTARPGSYTSANVAGWESNLLLEPYQDDPPGTGAGAGAYAVGSALCTGCHWNPASGNHHVLTGDVVPLSGLPLRTGAVSFADQASAPVGGGAAPGTLSYPGVDAMDCDSCHRPHRADSDGDVVGPAHGSRSSSDGLPTRHILEVDGAGHRYSDLCLECHAR